MSPYITYHQPIALDCGCTTASLRYWLTARCRFPDPDPRFPSPLPSLLLSEPVMGVARFHGLCPSSLLLIGFSPLSPGRARDGTVLPRVVILHIHNLLYIQMGLQKKLKCTVDLSQFFPRGEGHLFMRTGMFTGEG